MHPFFPRIKHVAETELAKSITPSTRALISRYNAHTHTHTYKGAREQKLANKIGQLLKSWYKSPTRRDLSYTMLIPSILARALDTHAASGDLSKRAETSLAQVRRREPLEAPILLRQIVGKEGCGLESWPRAWKLFHSGRCNTAVTGRAEKTTRQVRFYALVKVLNVPSCVHMCRAQCRWGKRWMLWLEVYSVSNSGRFHVWFRPRFYIYRVNGSFFLAFGLENSSSQLLCVILNVLNQREISQEAVRSESFRYNPGVIVILTLMWWHRGRRILINERSLQMLQQVHSLDACKTALSLLSRNQ